MNATTSGMLLLLTVLLCPIGRGQGQDDAVKKQLDKAVGYYAAAQFEKAIDILTVLSKKVNLERGVRKDVLLGLCRSYNAMRQNEKLMAAMGRLLSLEPPIIEIDPDAECPALLKSYYQARKSKSGTLALERRDPAMKTIAVLDFMNRSVDDREKYDPLEKGFADLIIGQLHGATELKVVERERIQWILSEIALENDPRKFDVTSAVRVGKQLGVHAVLLGSYIKVKDEMWIGARLVKVETSEILMTDEVKGDAEDFFELAEQLSKKVAKGINVVIAEQGTAKKAATESLEAMLSYSEGLVALERGKYKVAYDKFMAAFKLDPTYEKARTKAESIKPMLG